MSSSIDENCDSKKKEADVKFAETEATPDLKVDDDNFALRLVVPAPEAKTQSAPTESAASPTDPESEAPPEPPMPRIITGVATVVCVWFCVFMAFTSNFASWHESVRWAFGALGAFALHLAWFANSLKQLQAHTNKIVPECPPAPRQNWLLTLLPASWPVCSGFVFGSIYSRRHHRCWKFFPG